MNVRRAFETEVATAEEQPRMRCAARERAVLQPLRRPRNRQEEVVDSIVRSLSTNFGHTGPQFGIVTCSSTRFKQISIDVVIPGFERSASASVIPPLNARPGNSGTKERGASEPQPR